MKKHPVPIRKTGSLRTLVLAGLAGCAQKLVEGASAGVPPEVAVIAGSGAVALGVAGGFLVNRAWSEHQSDIQSADSEGVDHLRRGLAAALRQALAGAASMMGDQPAIPYRQLFAGWEMILNAAEKNNDVLDIHFPPQFTQVHWDATNPYHSDREIDAQALAEVLRGGLIADASLMASWNKQDALVFARKILPLYQQAFVSLAIGDTEGFIFRTFAVKSLDELRSLAQQNRQAGQQLLRIGKDVLAAVFDIKGQLDKHPKRINQLWLTELHQDRASLLDQFVGREHELASAQRWIQKLSEHGGTLLVTGETGIGKSSFLCQLYERIHERHGIVIHDNARLQRKPVLFAKRILSACTALVSPALEFEPTGDAAELRQQLVYAAKQLTDATGRAPILVVDSLNELLVTNQDWERALAWLPFRLLPPRTVLVLGCQRLKGLMKLFQGNPTVTEYRLQKLGADDENNWLSMQFGSDAHSAKLVMANTFRSYNGNMVTLRQAARDAHDELGRARTEKRPAVSLPATYSREHSHSRGEAIWLDMLGRGPGRPVRMRLLQYLACAFGSTFPKETLTRLMRRHYPSFVHNDLELILTDIQAGLTGTSAAYYLHDSVVQVVLEKDPDSAQHHKEIVEELEARTAYWRDNVTEHIQHSSMPTSERLKWVHDQVLLDERLLHGKGALHGEWLNQELGTHAESDRSAFCDHLLVLCEQLIATSDVGRAAEMADMLQTIGYQRFIRAAEEIYRGLYSSTNDIEYRRQRATILFQGLDLWAEARQDLHICAQTYSQRNERVKKAQCERLLALSVFDMGGDGPDAPETLLRSCMEEFDRAGLPRDKARSEETLGVVLDAEGRWDEALVLYDRAIEHYEIQPDRLDCARARLSRAMALLFVKGIEPAVNEIERSDVGPFIEKNGGAQLRGYYYVTRCLLSLLSGNFNQFMGFETSAACTDELWLCHSLRESRGIYEWLALGKIETAITLFCELEKTFELELEDAWGGIDNRVNLALALLQLGAGRADAVITSLGADYQPDKLLGRAYRESCDQQYPIGRAMAYAALAEWFCPPIPPDHHDDSDFYERHLRPLFKYTHQPFLPCYVLLAEPLVCK